MIDLKKYKNLPSSLLVQVVNNRKNSDLERALCLLILYEGTPNLGGLGLKKFPPGIIPRPWKHDEPYSTMFFAKGPEFVKELVRALEVCYGIKIHYKGDLIGDYSFRAWVTSPSKV